ncbi:hypothetical protein [Actinocatenispora rupis]|uniref:Heparinase II/III-like protein n=1 Tax=Actinocatenispora rupis TaxID=519421 RepID=A0A8J3IWR1_9ACTN|nr:hypothetical protein [Actinocatenispora rupis]GID10050.1 hypothetical protein Aru02nite_09390 [Actinocatenispora rupis]
MKDKRFLADSDEHYEPDVRLPWSVSRSNGYHTRIPAGTRVHETRGAADYALVLLADGAPDRIRRAHDVLDALLDLQNTDPTAEHYGLWGYFREEPAEQMAPADWNWADFIGVRLAQVLAAHAAALDPPVRTRVEEGLRHAALAIFRRNVGAAYTNIALLGAVTCAAAGELLAMPYLVGYARIRLTRILERLDADGGFAEYNSPTYSPFLLDIAERSAVIVADAEVAALVEQVRVRAWEALAERFHPGTGQLAGPQARAYEDWLRPGIAQYLAEQTGAPVEPHAGVPEDPTPRVAPALPCPPHLAPRFACLPTDPHVVRTGFGIGNRGVELVGTTWLTADACLGTTNEEFAWTQRRPLLGYWRTATDPAVVLRARILLNGHDLTAAWCRQVQDGPRVLSAWWLSYDSGDFHPNLDKPADSLFAVEDLRLRVSLRGTGVSGRANGADTFTLAAGERHATVHTGQADFLGTQAEWTLSEVDGEVAAEAVLYSGERRTVDFHDAVLRAGFAVELHAATEPHTDAPVRRDDGADAIAWRWADLAVDTPARPTPFA